MRRGDPLTSHHAADTQTAQDRNAARAAVLAVLRGTPRADHETVEILSGVFTPSRVRTARHELVERGIVKDTDRTRLTPAGNPAIVWGIA